MTPVTKKYDVTMTVKAVVEAANKKDATAMAKTTCLTTDMTPVKGKVKTEIVERVAAVKKAPAKTAKKAPATKATKSKKASK